MEARTGDSASEKPVRVVPVSSVTFTQLVPIPGFKDRATQVVTGGFRMDDGKQKQFPQVFLDLGMRTIVISGQHYPMERVVCFERAKAALSKLPAAPAIPNYTIGAQTSEPLTKKA